MKYKTFCFDIDNTICKTIGNNYHLSKPYPRAVRRINNLYNTGHTIKLFTARYMGRSKDNLKNKRRVYSRIKKQIDSWGLKYNKLFISKPSSDIYIDDKSYGYSDRWIKDFKKYETKS